MSNPNTLRLLDTGIARMQEDSDGPHPADQFKALKWHMAAAHACILISIKNFYLKAHTIQSVDQHDFLLYVLFWVDFVDNHHAMEEDWFMESLNGAVSRDNIVHEHDTFRESFHDLEHWAEACLPIGTKWGFRGHAVKAEQSKWYDAVELERLIDILAANFIEHFCAEPSYLEDTKLRPHLTDEELKAVIDRAMAWLQSKPESFHVFTEVHRPSQYLPPVSIPITPIDGDIWRFGPLPLQY